MEVITLEEVQIELKDDWATVYIDAIIDDGTSTFLSSANFEYVPEEWPEDEQFTEHTGEPTKAQRQWIDAMLSNHYWEPVKEEVV